MLKEEIQRNIRTEKAFRRFSGALMIFAVAVIALITLSAFLKFEPKVGEDITDGKLKQFLDAAFKNRALVKLAILSLIAGVLSFLPDKGAFLSLFSSTAAVSFYYHVRESVKIEPFPNGFLCVYTVFFGATLCCAALRFKNRASMEKRIYPSSLSILASAILLGISALSYKLDRLTVQYEEYVRFGNQGAEGEKMDFGDFHVVVEKLKYNNSDILIRTAILFAFLGLITLVLSKFPRMSIAAPAYGFFYILYNITVERIVSMKFVFFTLGAMAIAAVAAIPASPVTPTAFPEPDEFDENGDEDDGEDDGEYEEIKKEFEERGQTLEEY